ncbi:MULTISPECIES: hypothetical protein [Citrobacter]|uniref:hypothetical protein n=1 Tax=Citrobacter TaxID=544 RepID=UPI0010A42058|nr:MULTISPECIES: hypothetical protein [Citrobacter]MCQ7059871.1 hypothetical protein [Escherichia coli]MDM2929772.1 hypothetical protein [Citrobacter sp. Cm046]
MMKRVIILGAVTDKFPGSLTVNQRGKNPLSPLFLHSGLKKQQRQQEEAHRNEKFGAFPAFITYRCLSGSF